MGGIYQTGLCCLLLVGQYSQSANPVYVLWYLCCTLPLVHPFMLQKWIQFKFRMQNPVKANQKFTYSNQRWQQIRGVLKAMRDNSWHLLWLCQLLYGQHWEQQYISRVHDVAEIQAQQLLHKLALDKTVQKTPSVTEVKLKRCPQSL